MDRSLITMVGASSANEQVLVIPHIVTWHRFTRESGNYIRITLVTGMIEVREEESPHALDHAVQNWYSNRR